MRRRDENNKPGEGWLPWFQGVLRRRGYDIDSPRGGAPTRLAEETGLAQSSISRILAGAVPNYESTVMLSRVLDIPLPVFLIRTGKATEDDFEQSGTITDHTGVLSGKPLSPEEVAIAAGVPVGDRDWFATMVRRIRRENADDDEGTAGGAATRG